MANVRRVNSAGTDRLNMAGTGSAVNGTGFTLLWMGRLLNTSTQPLMAIVNGASATIGTIYIDAGLINFGSQAGDTGITSATLNSTDAFLFAISQTTGGAIRGHGANLTTGAAATHADGTTGTIGTTTWGHTEIGTADGGGFTGDKNHGMAAVFSSVLTDANFNTLAAAKTTQAVFDMGVGTGGLWDFNQASTGTSVPDLSGNALNQSSITGTSVVSDTAIDVWTFGVSSGGGGGASPFPALQIIRSNIRIGP